MSTLLRELLRQLEELIRSVDGNLATNSENVPSLNSEEVETSIRVLQKAMVTCCTKSAASPPAGMEGKSPSYEVVEKLLQIEDAYHLSEATRDSRRARPAADDEEPTAEEYNAASSFSYLLSSLLAVLEALANLGAKNPLLRSKPRELLPFLFARLEFDYPVSIRHLSALCLGVLSSQFLQEVLEHFSSRMKRLKKDNDERELVPIIRALRLINFGVAESHRRLATLGFFERISEVMGKIKRGALMKEMCATLAVLLRDLMRDPRLDAREKWLEEYRFSVGGMHHGSVATARSSPLARPSAATFWNEFHAQHRGDADQLWKVFLRMYKIVASDWAKSSKHTPYVWPLQCSMLCVANEDIFFGKQEGTETLVADFLNSLIGSLKDKAQRPLALQNLVDFVVNQKFDANDRRTEPYVELILQAFPKRKTVFTATEITLYRNILSGSAFLSRTLAIRLVREMISSDFQASDEQRTVALGALAEILHNFHAEAQIRAMSTELHTLVLHVLRTDQHGPTVAAALQCLPLAWPSESNSLRDTLKVVASKIIDDSNREVQHAAVIAIQGYMEYAPDDAVSPCLLALSSVLLERPHSISPEKVIKVLASLKIVADSFAAYAEGKARTWRSSGAAPPIPQPCADPPAHASESTERAALFSADAKAKGAAATTDATRTGGKAGKPAEPVSIDLVSWRSSRARAEAACLVFMTHPEAFLREEARSVALALASPAVVALEDPQIISELGLDATARSLGVTLREYDDKAKAANGASPSPNVSAAVTATVTAGVAADPRLPMPSDLVQLYERTGAWDESLDAVLRTNFAAHRLAVESAAMSLWGESSEGELLRVPEGFASGANDVADSLWANLVRFLALSLRGDDDAPKRLRDLVPVFGRRLAAFAHEANAAVRAHTLQCCAAMHSSALEVILDAATRQESETPYWCRPASIDVFAAVAIAVPRSAASVASQLSRPFIAIRSAWLAGADRVATLLPESRARVAGTLGALATRGLAPADDVGAAAVLSFLVSGLHAAPRYAELDAAALCASAVLLHARPGAVAGDSDAVDALVATAADAAAAVDAGATLSVGASSGGGSRAHSATIATQAQRAAVVRAARAALRAVLHADPKRASAILREAYSPCPCVVAAFLAAGAAEVSDALATWVRDHGVSAAQLTVITFLGACAPDGAIRRHAAALARAFIDAAPGLGLGSIESGGGAAEAGAGGLLAPLRAAAAPPHYLAAALSFSSAVARGAPQLVGEVLAELERAAPRLGRRGLESAADLAVPWCALVGGSAARAAGEDDIIRHARRLLAISRPLAALGSPLAEAAMRRMWRAAAPALIRPAFVSMLLSRMDSPGDSALCRRAAAYVAEGAGAVPIARYCAASMRHYDAARVERWDELRSAAADLKVRGGAEEPTSKECAAALLLCDTVAMARGACAQEHAPALLAHALVLVRRDLRAASEVAAAAAEGLAGASGAAAVAALAAAATRARADAGVPGSAASGAMQHEGEEWEIAEMDAVYGRLAAGSGGGGGGGNDKAAHAASRPRASVSLAEAPRAAEISGSEGRARRGARGVSISASGAAAQRGLLADAPDANAAAERLFCVLEEADPDIRERLALELLRWAALSADDLLVRAALRAITIACPAVSGRDVVLVGVSLSTAVRCRAPDAAAEAAALIARVMAAAAGVPSIAGTAAAVLLALMSSTDDVELFSSASAALAIAGAALREDKPRGGGWRATTDDEGRTYYYHTQSKLTAWVLPEGESLAEERDDRAVQTIRELFRSAATTVFGAKPLPALHDVLLRGVTAQSSYADSVRLREEFVAAFADATSLASPEVVTLVLHRALEVAHASDRNAALEHALQLARAVKVFDGHEEVVEALAMEGAVPMLRAVFRALAKLDTSLLELQRNAFLLETILYLIRHSETEEPNLVLPLLQALHALLLECQVTMDEEQHKAVSDVVVELCYYDFERSDVTCEAEAIVGDMASVLGDDRFHPESLNFLAKAQPRNRRISIMTPSKSWLQKRRVAGESRALFSDASPSDGPDMRSEKITNVLSHFRDSLLEEFSAPPPGTAVAPGNSEPAGSPVPIRAPSSDALERESPLPASSRSDEADLTSSEGQRGMEETAAAAAAAYDAADEAAAAAAADEEDTANAAAQEASRAAAAVAEEAMSAAESGGGDDDSSAPPPPPPDSGDEEVADEAVVTRGEEAAPVGLSSGKMADIVRSDREELERMRREREQDMERFQ